jgi:hypothetical protein
MRMKTGLTGRKPWSMPSTQGKLRNMEKSINEIIANDVKRNWSNSGLSPEQAYAIMNRKVKRGEKIFRYKDILIPYKQIDDETVEYHAINGDMSWDDLDKAVLAFALTMRDRGIRYAITYFNDEKLKKGFNKQKIFPVAMEEINDPRGKYVVIARLS